jgi:membrane fusion protein (multidrug efflux system)
MTEQQVRTANSTHRRKRWPLAAAAGVAAMTAVTALFWYYSGRESTDDAQIDGHITQIGAKVGGTVVRIEAIDNQQVEAGALLVEIDPREYQVALDRASAELTDAEAAAQAAETGVPITTTTTASDVTSATGTLEQARAGLAAAEAEIQAAKARLVSIRARLREKQADATKAARDVERLKMLIAKDQISRQQYDAAVAATDAANAVVEGARSDITAAETAVNVTERRADQARATLAQAQATVRAAETAPEQVKVTRAQASAAAAKVMQAKAALAQAHLNLEHTTIKAPATGVVSKRSVEVGQVVQPGQPLLALVTLGDVWVTANFKETQIQSIRPGQRAVISVDAFGGRTFEGHVDSLAPATGARFSLLPPENAAGNFVKVVQRVAVKIVIEKGQDPQQLLLRPGLSVTPTVYTRETEKQ